MRAPAPITDDSASRRRPGTMGWLMLSPLLLWLTLFVIAPTLLLIVFSFCQRGNLTLIVYDFTFDNYIRVADPSYLKIFIRSIYYAALTTVICIVLGYPVAYFIGRAGENWRNRLLMLVMIPFWTSFLIRTYAWITILKQEGLLNGFLMSFGTLSGPLDILYTPTAVVIGLVYAYLPFMILPIYGSVEKLDNSILEAAMDLGAGPVRAFSKVIIPLTSPGIIAGTLLVFIPAVGMFAVTDLMGGGQNPTIGKVIQNQFSQARDWPFGAALGVTLLVLFTVSFIICSRFSKTAD
jgi:spermidine/putrescine transport system permease protein